MAGESTDGITCYKNQEGNKGHDGVEQGAAQPAEPAGDIAPADDEADQKEPDGADAPAD